METIKKENAAPLFDEELQGIFGSRYSDESTAPVKKVEKTEPVKPAEKKRVDPLEPAKWAPPKPAPDWLAKLKMSTKWTVLYSGLCVLFFYWQQTGLMDPAAALPSMLACTLLAGVSIGRVVTK